MNNVTDTTAILEPAGAPRTVDAKRIIVVGMGRSGTSFLTEFLAGCGVYVDEVSDKFESAAARGIDDALLEQVYGAKHGLPYGKLPDQEIDVTPEWQAKADAFVREMDERWQAQDGAKYWAFKDPRATVLHKMWLHHFDVVVGIYRRPDQVAESYTSKRWVGWWRPRRRALDYWMRFNQSLLEIERQVRGVKPFYLLDYNGDVPAQGLVLAEKLGLEVPAAALDLYKPERNHFQTPKPVTDARALAMYEQLKQLRNLT